MASSFVGLPVLCTLSNNSSISGTVSSIDAIQGAITLSDATLKRANGEISYLASQVLARTEVTGLQVLDVNKGSPRSSDGARRPPTSTQPQPTPSRSTSNLSGQFDHHHHHHHSQSPIPSTSSSRGPSPKLPGSASKKKAPTGAGANKKKANPGPGQGRKPSGGNEADVSEAYGDDDSKAPITDTAAPINQDFDFSAGLRSFDKAAVFEQIRSQDTVDPSHRLHAHNKKDPNRKLAPDENVLSQSELDLQRLELGEPRGAPVPVPVSGHTRQMPLPQVDSTASEYEEEEEAPAMRVPAPIALEAKAPVLAVAMAKEKGKGKKNGAAKSTAGAAMGTGLVTKSGVRVSTVRLREWEEVIGIADIESGPTASQRLESFSLLLSQFILSTLSARHYLAQKPTLCLLVSSGGEKASAVVRMGTWAVGHGAKVVVLLVEGEGAEGTEWKAVLRGFSTVGGRVLRDVSDLAQDYDLIVEALSENRVATAATPIRPSKSATSAAAWAADIGLPLLSIDAPFGADHDTGLSLLPEALAPDFILCRGAIRAGCAATSKAELVLVDVGIGAMLWRRVGVDDWEEGVWGNEWVVGIKRA